MTVDHRKGRFLAAQMQRYRDQRDMLDDIGKIARVISVAIIHRGRMNSIVIANALGHARMKSRTFRA